MKKLVVLGAILATCLSTSTAMADESNLNSLNLPEMNITLAGGAVNYYKEALGSTQVGMELALPICHELYLVAEGGGSFFFIPLLNMRLMAGPRIQTENGVVANFGIIYEYTQGLDYERPDSNFWGGHMSLMVPIDAPHGIRIGPTADFAVNPNNNSTMLFVGLKVSLPIDLTGQDANNYRPRDIYNRRR